ncbi:MAG: hypothetical protein AAF184_06650 [Pseudomonadota bacterium]
MSTSDLISGDRWAVVVPLMALNQRARYGTPRGDEAPRQPDENTSIEDAAPGLRQLAKQKHQEHDAAGQ